MLGSDIVAMAAKIIANANQLKHPTAEEYEGGDLGFKRLVGFFCFGFVFSCHCHDGCGKGKSRGIRMNRRFYVYVYECVG